MNENNLCNQRPANLELHCFSKMVNIFKDNITVCLLWWIQYFLDQPLTTYLSFNYNVCVGTAIMISLFIEKPLITYLDCAYKLPSWVTNLKPWFKLTITYLDLSCVFELPSCLTIARKLSQEALQSSSNLSSFLWSSSQSTWNWKS